MTKLVKYLKGSGSIIALVLALLVIQASCDLALPSYMSNIVDIGIQQRGIDDAVPQVIREVQMDQLLNFISDTSDKRKITGSYELLEGSAFNPDEWKSLLKEYPALEDGPIYRLKNIKDKELQKTADLMKRPSMILYMMENGGGEAEGSAEGQQSEDRQQMSEVTDSETQAQTMQNIDTEIAKIPEAMQDQIVTQFIKAEYDTIGVNTNKMQSFYIIVTGAKMLGLALISMAVTIAVGFFASRMAAGIGRDLRGQIFNKVVSFSNSEFDKFSTASLITRSTNDIQQIQMLVVMFVRIVAYAPIIGIGGILKVLDTNTSMAWIIGIAVAAIMIVIVFLFSFVMPKFKVMQKMVDQLNLVTREILSGLPVIRAFSREKFEEKRFDNANRDLTKTSLFVNRAMTFMMPTMMLIMNAVTVLIVWSGAKSINNGTMQVGDMMAFMQYTMQIIMAFLMISMVSIMLPRASVSAARVDEVLTTEVNIQDKTETKKMVNHKKGQVIFDHVFFRYPGADEDVLQDITFTAKPGETTAIIGSTGSGKTTLISLIPRFYDVKEGAVLVNGVDVRDTAQAELRDKLGYVPQKGVLFSGTIESNISYGVENAKEEQIEEAARIAQAADFIEERQEQYKSPIAQGGSNVSGGQKQRLSIARAITKKPEIFIFDDSFSALDYKTDINLRKALKKTTLNSAVIIVAQRISTILHAEQIIVLEEGKIVGKGTHHKLLKSCEVYKQIALSQLSEEELAGEVEGNE